MSRFRPSRNYVSGKVVFDGGPVDISGDLVVSGTITANEYQVNVINTNVTHIDADGDTKFGDTPDDTHQFTGSVYINGPISASSFIGPISATPAGTNTQVQFNADGAFEAATQFTWATGSNTLDINGHISSSTVSISSSNPAETLFRIDSYDSPYLMTVDASSTLDGAARLMMRNSNDDITEPAGNLGRGLFHLEQESTSSAAIEANGLSIWTYAQNNYSSKITLSTWDPPVGAGSEIQFFTNDGTFPIGGVVDNQALGRMGFGGWDGNDTYLGSLIVARAVENWNFDVKNGTDIEFYTVPIGKGQNSNLKERIRFTSEGHLIVFPYSASNDDALPINTNYDRSAGAPALQVYGPTLFGSSSASTHIFTGSVNITGNLAASADISASFFYGDGSNLTGLNASNISAGTLDNARLPATISVTNVTASALVSASLFYGDGSNLTNVSAPLLVGKSLFVDSINGNDGTATRGSES
nr:hypothetical protein [Gammaproteobacteria bacterium]